MKDSKDFDVNQFVEVGTPTESTAATSNTQPSKRTVLTATTESDALALRGVAVGKTVSTPSSEQSVKPRQTVSALTTEPKPPTQMTSRTSTRQRRASLDEYREAFMSVPKIIDRQPVFVSRETRDRIGSVVRRLGERKMSVSGFLENLVRHHLNLYADDLEQWKRL
jgi:hypothetical protein